MLKVLFLAPLIIVSLYANELKQVSLQLQWKYQFQFAGYIMAKEKGFYEDVGLDVTLKEWQPGIEMVDVVLSETSEYGVSRPSSMIDISNGKEIVYLASIFQSSPLILLADKSSGVTTVKDFVGKQMMSSGNMNTEASFISMMLSQGVDINDVIIKEPSFNPRDLMQGKTDLMASYISNEPYVLREMGGKPVVFSPKDYGFDFYSDIVITSRKYLENNPAEVKNFKNATIRGWEYAFENIEETVAIIYEKYNTQNRSKDALLYEAKELKELAYYQTYKIGKIQSSKLEKIYDVYKLLGLVQNNINYKQIIYNDTTLKLELNKKEKEYLKKKKSIKMCVDPSWMPFESLDANTNHIGKVADYYKFFEKILDVKFEVVQTSSWSESVAFARKRKCDILSLSMQTPQRNKYMDYTSSFISTSLVVATKPEAPFVDKISDLSDKKLGITKDYAFIEILKNKHLNLNIIEVENIDDGLERVYKGELYAYIGTLTSVEYKFQKKYLGKLKIAGKIGDDWELGIGLRNDDPLLMRVLQKAVNNISHEQQKEIENKWTALKYEQEADYTLLYQVIAVFLVVLLIILFFYYKLKQLKDKLEIAYEELQELAVIDKLTKLYNRHKIDAALEQEKKRADRYKMTFGVIMLDIDHFKKINDTYGHHAGDIVLQELANILKTNSRITDIVGRWGGEEFLIVLPQTDKEASLEFAQHLREKIQEYKFSTIGTMTASLGVTIYKREESVENTIIRADDALYASKKNGRNLVTFK